MAEHRFHTPEPVELEIKVPAGDIDIETVEGDESFVSSTAARSCSSMTEVARKAAGSSSR